MVGHAAQSFDGLDVLFNNAGIIETSLADECAVDTLPEDVWDAVYEVNLKAVWLTTKFAAPHLKRSTRGPAIVNTASVSGLTGFANAAVYGKIQAHTLGLGRKLNSLVRTHDLVGRPSPVIDEIVQTHIEGLRQSHQPTDADVGAPDLDVREERLRHLTATSEFGDRQPATDTQGSNCAPEAGQRPATGRISGHGTPV
jgi:short-subunit dehydrogenase involved in D-alanine esterification of teichoic acids